VIHSVSGQLVSKTNAGTLPYLTLPAVVVQTSCAATLCISVIFSFIYSVLHLTAKTSIRDRRLI